MRQDHLTALVYLGLYCADFCYIFLKRLLEVLSDYIIGVMQTIKFNKVSFIEKKIDAG
jgi:hypothetical protein